MKLAGARVAAVVGSLRLLQIDAVRRELVVQIEAGRLLAQGVPRDALERLLDVQRLLGGRLEVGHVVFRLAPLLRPLGGNGARLQVDLVAQQDEREVFGLAGRRLDEELVPPAVERFEGVGGRHVEHWSENDSLTPRDQRRLPVLTQHATIGTPVKGDTQRLEPFLPRRVPYLHSDDPVVDYDLFC